MDATHILKNLFYRAENKESCISLNQEQINRLYDYACMDDDEEINCAYLYYDNNILVLTIGYLKDGVQGCFEYNQNDTQDIIEILTGLSSNFYNN